MIEAIVIIALLVLSIWYTMQEGEIFYSLGRWLEQNTPSKIHPALFECNVCMCPWYGSVLYVLLYGVNTSWPVTIIGAMGINIVINKLSTNE